MNRVGPDGQSDGTWIPAEGDAGTGIERDAVAGSGLDAPDPGSGTDPDVDSVAAVGQGFCPEASVPMRFP